MNTASQNIRHLRKRYQLTQEQMAHKLGIKRSLLGAYEESRANPRLEVLVKAAELFNVSVDQLVSDTLETSPPEDKSTKEYRQDNFQSGNRRYREGINDEKRSVRYENKDSRPSRQQLKRPYLPPRKIEIPSTDPKKSLQRLRLVSENVFKQYFFNAFDQEFLKSLPELILPLPSSGDTQYRAFEIADDAMHPLPNETIVVGKKIENIQRLKDGSAYILITRAEGVLFRRVFNHIENSGELLLEANHKEYAQIKLSVIGREIEAWEVVLYISTDDPHQITPPKDKQSMDLPKLTSIVRELQEEVIRLKKIIDV